VVVEKRLIGSGCRLNGDWGRQGMGVLDGVEIAQGKREMLGVNLGRPIVTNGNFVA